LLFKYLEHLKVEISINRINNITGLLEIMLNNTTLSSNTNGILFTNCVFDFVLNQSLPLSNAKPYFFTSSLLYPYISEAT